MIVDSEDDRAVRYAEVDQLSSFFNADQMDFNFSPSHLPPIQQPSYFQCSPAPSNTEAYSEKQLYALILNNQNVLAQQGNAIIQQNNAAMQQNYHYFQAVKTQNDLIKLLVQSIHRDSTEGDTQEEEEPAATDANVNDQSRPAGSPPT